MAVPKKRTSKSKKNLRKTVWKKKALKQAVKAYSIIKKIEQLNSKNLNQQIPTKKSIADQSTTGNTSSE